MTNSNNKQRGFTLIELLVVIGIIAALAAVVIPNVSRFMGSGDDSANEAEAQNVQSAMDLYMTDTASATVTELLVGAATDDFALSDPVLFPDYIRQNPTKCTYSWTTGGLVTQQVCS